MTATKEIMFARILKANKEWAEYKAAEMGISLASFMDLKLYEMRRKEEARKQVKHRK